MTCYISYFVTFTCAPWARRCILLLHVCACVVCASVDNDVKMDKFLTLIGNFKQDMWICVLIVCSTTFTRLCFGLADCTLVQIYFTIVCSHWVRPFVWSFRRWDNILFNCNICSNCFHKYCWSSDNIVKNAVFTVVRALPRYSSYVSEMYRM